MRPLAPSAADLERALAAFPRMSGARAEPFGSGLINHTYRASVAGELVVLQRLSPIFSASIHDNIDFVTHRLEAAGLLTPRLLPAADGKLWAELPDGIWRLQTYVDGRSFASLEGGPHQAFEAGRLVGRFHAALEGVEHAFSGLRFGVHDTEEHLRTLRREVDRHADHRLHAEVEELAGEISSTARRLTPLPDLPTRVCHGDLKITNLLFEPDRPATEARALCLIDLDTVGPQALAHELGDAWRSWCGIGGEEKQDACFDLEIFAASLRGYHEALGRALTDGERLALLLGVEWISLELAARFAADALSEGYFGWDAARFAGAGEHHLCRARAQWALHHSIIACHDERKHLLEKIGRD